MSDKINESLYKVCLEYYIVAESKEQAHLCVTSSISPEDVLGFEVIPIFTAEDTEVAISFMESLTGRMTTEIVEEVMISYLGAKGIAEDVTLEVIDAMKLAIKERKMTNDNKHGTSAKPPRDPEDDSFDSCIPRFDPERDN